MGTKRPGCWRGLASAATGGWRGPRRRRSPDPAQVDARSRDRRRGAPRLADGRAGTGGRQCEGDRRPRSRAARWWSSTPAMAGTTRAPPRVSGTCHRKGADPGSGARAARPAGKARPGADRSDPRRRPISSPRSTGGDRAAPGRQPVPVDPRRQRAQSAGARRDDLFLVRCRVGRRGGAVRARRECRRRCAFRAKATVRSAPCWSISPIATR